MPERGPHRGVNEADARNRGILEHFRPAEITTEYVRARFAKIYARESAAHIDARAAKFMADEAAKPIRAPPLGQSLDQVKDRFYGLGTHPDIVERLWLLDRGLPASCRWVVWGYPALVHPLSGVIFAIGFGTIGVAMRLPAELSDAGPQARADVSGKRDIAAAGPEWRLLGPCPEAASCRAAFDFAAAPAA